MLLKRRHRNVRMDITMFKYFCFSLFIDFAMPATFQMVPLKMSILDIEGTKTYFFKVIVKNFVIVIIYLILGSCSQQ